MSRGERLIKLGNSWFSAKSIEVEHYMYWFWGRALNECRGFHYSTKFKETPNTKLKYIVDRFWARRSKIERETAQLVC